MSREMFIGRSVTTLAYQRALRRVASLTPFGVIG